jgi:RNA polymerase sigma-70 factor, ECF subfamily
MRGGGGETPPETAATRASIFLKLNGADPSPRELAWAQFYQRYAPIISSYAFRHGANRQQADEIVQDVIAGFFEASPRFVYDPARGRFRGYLKACVARALQRKNLSRARAQTVQVDEIDVPDQRGASNDDLWEKLWQQQILRRAMEIVRDQYTRKGKLQTFLAFEHNVVRDLGASDVAALLDMNVASVHAAKSRVMEKLREVRARLDEEDG